MMAKTFTCRKLHCKGITPKCCIKRQFAGNQTARSSQDEYITCLDCKQGDKILSAYPELAPNDKPKKVKTVSHCKVCGEKFQPHTKLQETCSRICGQEASRIKRGRPNALSYPV